MMTNPTLRFTQDNGCAFPDWQDSNLGELCEITTGNSNVDENLEAGKYRFFDRGIDSEHYLDTYFLDKEAIIYAGEGASFYPRYYKGKFALHQRCYALFDFVNVNGAFLYQYLNTCNNHFIATAVGSTVKSLRRNCFMSCPVKLPCLEEQQKIAAFFTALDEKICNIQKEIKKTNELKECISKMLFSSAISFKKEDGSNYGKWNKVKIKDLGVLNPSDDTLPDEFIYIDLESVERGLLKKKQIVQKVNAPSRAQRILKKNDVLFQLVRPYQKNNYLFSDEFDVPTVASTGYAVIRVSQHLPKFIYQALLQESFIKQVLNRCTGGTYPAINTKDFGAIDVLIPSLEEQKRISQLLDALDKKNLILHNKQNLYTILKQSFMQQMFV